MTRRFVGILALCFALGGVGSIGHTLRAQSAPVASARRTVWSGVFTAEQARRGKDQYERHCTACHGVELGGGDGPALSGSDFLRSWIEDDVSNLVEKVQQRMPTDAPGTLTVEEATDIVSFLLEANGFPAGSAEMPANRTALSSIRIEDQTGPGPVPNFSLVQVMGCLLETRDKQWTLTNGTEPRRSRESAPSARAADAPLPALGTQTFQLMDATSVRPQNAAGHLVEVKGLLMRQPTGAALNVTSLQSLSPRCP